MIKELNKYSEELTRYRKQGGLPQGDVKNALVDIYEANWESNKHWGSSKINRTCPSCISDMMKSLCAEFEKNIRTHKIVKSPRERYAEALNEIRAEEQQEEFKKIQIVDYTKLKWGELKSFATKHGVNIKGKKKVDILAELDELFKDD